MLRARALLGNEEHHERVLQIHLVRGQSPSFRIWITAEATRAATAVHGTPTESRWHGGGAGGGHGGKY